MKKILLIVSFALLIPVSLIAQDAQEGFTGPSGRTDSRGRPILSVSVAEVARLRDDTLVSLQGNILRSLGDEKYTFRDSSGDILIEIDRHIWRGLSVSETDLVEISGEVEKERRRVEIDVKNIVKISG